jgi:hypothetical protein
MNADTISAILELSLWYVGSVIASFLFFRSRKARLGYAVIASLFWFVVLFVGFWREFRK